MPRNAALIALACLMTYLAGKDANWDLLNYHLYIAHAWVHSKYLTDFMGAGPNSYFNPLGYLPFYAMVMAGWHSLAIGLLLGAFHGLGLIILWEISERFLFKGQEQARLLTTLSVLLAASSPVFAGTVGGTFLEPTLSVFVFASLYKRSNYTLVYKCAFFIFRDFWLVFIPLNQKPPGLVGFCVYCFLPIKS